MRAGIFGAALELADEAGLGWRLANIDADLVQGIHAVGGLPVSYTHLTLPTNREV